MIIYPAIDIIDGKCVRLSKGDYSQKKVYSSDLIAIAKKWSNSGSNYLHLVDLDGAKVGECVNYQSIVKIRKSFPNLFIQIGGGVRNHEVLQKYLNAGINRIILGTKVLEDKDFILSLSEQEKSKIAIDVAIKDGKLSGDGWEKTNEFDISEFIDMYESQGVSRFIITDISRDGMLQGINLESITSILEMITTKAIISGGISNISDIQSIYNLKSKHIDGLIIGKALYEDKIKLEEAISECS